MLVVLRVISTPKQDMAIFTPKRSGLIFTPNPKGVKTTPFKFWGKNYLILL